MNNSYLTWLYSLLKTGVTPPIWMSAGIGVLGASLLMLKRSKGLLRTFTRAIGIVCLFVSAYCLLLLALAPAYAKAAEIYELAEHFNRGPSFAWRDLVVVAIPTAASFAFGLWSGHRKAQI